MTRSLKILFSSVLLLASTHADAQRGASSARVRMAAPAAKPMTASHKDQSDMLRLLRLAPVQPHGGTYSTGPLAGSNVGNLYSWYVGHTGAMPAKLTIDWNVQLIRVWQRKFTISKTTVVRDTGKMLYAEYLRMDPGRMTLQQYQAIANREARTVCTSLNWQTVRRTYKLDARRQALLTRLCASIDGKTLISYAMTELLPTAGPFGRAYLDFLLRNAGRRYVESLPALHDPLTSFGPFQFTSKAVYDIGNIGPMGGANRMGKALPSTMRIPGSVALLRGDLHFRAGTLFALHNLAALIKRLDNRHLTIFERIASSRSLDVAQFIATAHNKPEVAYKAGIKWLDANAAGSYQAKCPEISRKYAQKTEKNFRSL